MIFKINLLYGQTCAERFCLSTVLLPSYLHYQSWAQLKQSPELSLGFPLMCQWPGITSHLTQYPAMCIVRKLESGGEPGNTSRLLAISVNAHAVRENGFLSPPMKHQDGHSAILPLSWPFLPQDWHPFWIFLTYRPSSCNRCSPCLLPFYTTFTKAGLVEISSSCFYSDSWNHSWESGT